MVEPTRTRGRENTSDDVNVFLIVCTTALGSGLRYSAEFPTDATILPDEVVGNNNLASLVGSALV